MVKTHLDKIVELFRRDTSHLPPGQRMSNIEALLYFDVLRRLRRKAYNTEALLSKALFCIEDLTFNSILIRANKQLKHIAKSINTPLPEELLAHMDKTESALEELWDTYSNQYYSRNFVTHKLIKEPTIATLMPLFSGAIDAKRAAVLVSHIKNPKTYGTKYPIPSVPLNSSWFKELGYWQGPMWLNTNWMIITGLREYGYNDLADILKQRTLFVAEKSGFYEYFSSKTGQPAGAKNFSWTASLVIELLKS